MSYRDRYENVIVTAENLDEFRSRGVHWAKLGDTVRVRHPATEVDLRPFAQLAESLGAPYPDKP